MAACYEPPLPRSRTPQGPPRPQPQVPSCAAHSSQPLLSCPLFGAPGIPNQGPSPPPVPVGGIRYYLSWLQILCDRSFSRSSWAMASRWWSGSLLAFLLLALFFFVFAVQWESPPTGTITRVPGGQQKPQFESTLALPVSWRRPFAVRAHQMRFSVVGLLPTFLLLITMQPPLDLVQLGLVAPHRAFAIACFSIGLPERLFSRLRPSGQSSGTSRAARQKKDWSSLLCPFLSPASRVPVVSVGCPIVFACSLPGWPPTFAVLACAGIMHAVEDLGS
ncbi:hypothetical protein B0T26DRAFT_339315 [Lasiosphaeria miniovina]|uniref:Uncharacterized protein n=1 Tax=Lasiosphaeria miniovina TaxID=1954250 RepID=A0AA40DT97_9PEZI|nr:uncharacterized protein B0T26DRAFT_339315 [Lasiosphaeria miniovina]KAK0712522.1 hypothetical protein B0T26DRAFT_339315 [Lasiosphaeria miniovina]